MWMKKRVSGLTGGIQMEWKTKVTELLDINYPIIQGGLAYLAYANLRLLFRKLGDLGKLRR